MKKTYLVMLTALGFVMILSSILFHEHPNYWIILLGAIILIIAFIKLQLFEGKGRVLTHEQIKELEEEEKLKEDIELMTRTNLLTKSFWQKYDYLKKEELENRYNNLFICRETSGGFPSAMNLNFEEKLKWELEELNNSYFNQNDFVFVCFYPKINLIRDYGISDYFQSFKKKSDDISCKACDIINHFLVNVEYSEKEYLYLWNTDYGYEGTKNIKLVTISPHLTRYKYILNVSNYPKNQLIKSWPKRENLQFIVKVPKHLST